MALLDFLKRKKEVEKAKDKKPETLRRVSGQEKAEKVSDVKDTKEVKEIKTTRSKKTGGFSYEVIREPHISEKSTNLNQNDKYVFKVYSDTNKPEIKKSVEGIYGVNVLSVNIIKIPKKKRRIGKTEGFRKGYTKAVVTIKEGQKIEIF